MEARVITCINCTMGCRMTVTLDGGAVVSVTGNTCKRGDEYARTEIVNPTRNIASTVKVQGGVHPVVPVKTSAPIPKTMIFDCMKEINNVCVNAPVSIGQVVIPNVLGTGVDIVATNID